MYTMNNPIRMHCRDDVDALRTEHAVYLAEENSKLPQRARNSGQTYCQQCGYCCLQQPCVPHPNEFNAIARYLNINPRELARKYTVINEDKGGYYLLWARETQNDIVGQYMPFYRSYDRGYCVFFDKENHTCKIHGARPKSAKDTECWKNTAVAYDGIWPIEQIQMLLPDFDPNGGRYVYRTNEIGFPCKVRVS